MRMSSLKCKSFFTGNACVVSISMRPAKGEQKNCAISAPQRRLGTRLGLLMLALFFGVATNFDTRKFRNNIEPNTTAFPIGELT